MNIMANAVKASEYFMRFVAIFLILMCVVNSQGLPEISDMVLEFSYTDGQLNHLREKRDANTDTVEYIIVVEVNVSQLILIEQIKSSLKSINFPLQLDNTTTINSFNITTVCMPVDSLYYCTCEDQYAWPDNNCIYDECNTMKEGACNCIGVLSSGGQMCVPKSDLQFFEFIVEIEINTTSTAAIGDMMNLLEGFSFPILLDNITEVTKVDITTVCSLNGTEYQCRCADQFFWPCEKCTVYGSCDNVTNGLCGCINAIPNDGQFCQLINELTCMYYKNKAYKHVHI
ncbi:adhesion G protein-coupled receptor F5-like isoform X2 [Pangasianodon hypophthalmus]|uniref:adhesion G protein-coupled receptor F5-like isoform X2 n=1 Tax=Pangasianodon hypophthalmus TaxID=310915 RepID=UPI00230823EB|nr:adhesion G protein-coupled receptor F5-like isoform X2 [Pangasianodon hypophthalmus]